MHGRRPSTHDAPRPRMSVQDEHHNQKSRIACPQQESSGAARGVPKHEFDRRGPRAQRPRFIVALHSLHLLRLQSSGRCTTAAVLILTAGTHCRYPLPVPTAGPRSRLHCRFALISSSRRCTRETSDSSTRRIASSRSALVTAGGPAEGVAAEGVAAEGMAAEGVAASS